MRYIKIETCKDCPNLDHRGGFGKVAYVPWCKLTKKDLPYMAIASNERSPATVRASSNFQIPESCPLPKDAS